MDYQQLKHRHRAERENYHPNLSLRVHRSLSWLQRAEQAEDLDGQFIFLWIAFNAAYATEIDDQYRTSEHSKSYKSCWVLSRSIVDNAHAFDFPH